MNSIAAVGRNFTGDLLFAIVSLYVVSFSLFTSMSMVITDISLQSGSRQTAYAWTYKSGRNSPSRRRQEASRGRLLTRRHEPRQLD